MDKPQKPRYLWLMYCAVGVLGLLFFDCGPSRHGRGGHDAGVGQDAQAGAEQRVSQDVPGWGGGRDNAQVMPDPGPGTPDQNKPGDRRSQPETRTTKDQGPTPEKSRDKGGDAGALEASPEAVNADRPLSGIVPNPPPSTPPKDAALQPKITKLSAFWRLLPGSTYRPIVVDTNIDVTVQGKTAISGLKVFAELYFITKFQTKRFEISYGQPDVSGTLTPGTKTSVYFNGFTTDHGLPMKQTGQRFCQKTYVAVLTFTYKQAQVSKSFRLIWRTQPFGCNCGGGACP